MRRQGRPSDAELGAISRRLRVVAAHGSGRFLQGARPGQLRDRMRRASGEMPLSRFFASKGKTMDKTARLAFASVALMCLTAGVPSAGAPTQQRAGDAAKAGLEIDLPEVIAEVRKAY